ncbi:hypothetical protein SAMN05421736_11060 [Evansella caseinilytica]|uniref:Uncharacterized protein n=1 Tax=Evansella caseinilytica TaxID=1503961 RepID=A0A1H3S909_9BACI|nr:hypothetical protein SAMN05421736_11060 [Evansella caseinilytica]
MQEKQKPVKQAALKFNSLNFRKQRIFSRCFLAFSAAVPEMSG